MWGRLFRKKPEESKPAAKGDLEKVKDLTSEDEFFPKLQDVLTEEQTRGLEPRFCFSPQGMLAYQFQSPKPETSARRDVTGFLFIHDLKNQPIKKLSVGTVKQMAWVDDNSLSFNIEHQKELMRWDRSKLMRATQVMGKFEHPLCELLALPYRQLATSHKSGEIFLWDADTGEKRKVGAVDDISPTLALSENGRLFVKGSDTVFECELKKGELKPLVTLERDSVFYRMFSVSPNQVALVRDVEDVRTYNTWVQVELSVINVDDPTKRFVVPVSDHLIRKVTALTLKDNRFAVVYEDLDRWDGYVNISVNVFDARDGHPLYAQPFSVKVNLSDFSAPQLDPRNLAIAIPRVNGQIYEFDWQHHLNYQNAVEEELVSLIPVRGVAKVVSGYLLALEPVGSKAKVEEVSDDPQQNQASQNARKK